MVLPTEIGDAAQDANRDRVMAWLDAGGSINDVDEDGYTLLNCCACGDREDSTFNSQHVALARELIALGADVNKADQGGRTPLYAAALGQHDDVVQLLLNSAANTSALNADGESALAVAVQSGHGEIVRLLQTARPSLASSSWSRSCSL